MRETVGRATKGGERAWSDHGGARAQIFSLSVVLVAVGKAAMDGWAREARRLMP